MSVPSDWTVKRIQWKDDCEKTAKFANALYISLFENDEPTPPPYAEVILLMRSVAPETFANLSSAAIVSWVDAWNETAEVVFRRSRRACLFEFCREAPWEGNPDLAGIGVRRLFPISTFRFPCNSVVTEQSPYALMS